MGCNLVLLLLVSGLLAEGAHAILCYQCNNCEDIEGEGNTEDCPTSSLCLTIKDIDTGEITKSCGIDGNNFLNFSNLCDRQENQIYCHCDTDLCNTNDLLPSTTFATNSTTQLVARITTTSTTSMATSSTDDWYCYSCGECGSSTGPLLKCDPITTVRACLYAKTPDGNELRGCADEELDAGIDVGCSYLNGYTFCKCLESGCNEYPRSSVTTTTTITTPTNEFYCYECANCGLDSGVLSNCASFTTSRSCYYGHWTNGTVIRSCGDEVLDQSTRVGCSHVLGLSICRCEQSGCNDYQPTTTVSAPSTTTTVSAAITTTTGSAPTTATAVFTPGEEPWSCYSCHDCGNSRGKIVTCSLIPAVTDCHLIQYPSGKIQRSCGRSIAGTEAVEFGCRRTYRGYMQCRCNERNCNEYPDITDSGPDVTTAATMPDTTTVQQLITAMESSGMAPNSSLSSQQSTTTAMQSITTGEPPFSCYVCRNCGPTAGFLVDCSLYTESKTCLLTKQPNGDVLRLCGTTELDAQLRSGCHTRRGYTFCKCSENACNVYPEVTEVTTTIPPTTTTESPFLCHICHDCGTELGPSLQCTSANSCSFILQQGIVIRSCGSPLLDLIITGDEGCTTTDDGQICKCSTPNCNIYSDITDSLN